MSVNTQPEREIPHRRSWSTLILGALIGAIVAAILVILIGMPFALGHRNDLPLERLYGDLAVGLATNGQAGNAKNPLQADNRTLEAGLNAYTGSCAVCHGANGDGKGVFGQGLYPAASNLTDHDTQEKSDAQLFWIIKNGLSFVGMPGFADQYNDQEIWTLVAYMRALGNKPADASAANTIPAATTAQLAKANPQGDTIQRGAAVYFAMGCHTCHGAVGNAPGQLGLHANEREAERAIRQGRSGMPMYDTSKISAAQLTDLEAYVNTFSGPRG